MLEGATFVHEMRSANEMGWKNTEPTGAKSDPCLLEGATFLHEMRGATEMG